MAASSDSTLVADLQDRDTTAISPETLARVLGLQLQEFARYAGVNRNTVRDNPSNSRLQEFSRNVVRALKAATDISGDPAKAAFLFKNDPIASFGYRTGLELVAGGRVEDLVGYLESTAAGFVG